jgi:hypothetical protein
MVDLGFEVSQWHSMLFQEAQEMLTRDSAVL